MERRIVSAVIGCGRMGAFTSESVRKYAPPCWFPLSHAEAIRHHPELELRALCDANAQSLQRAATAYGVVQTYEDSRRLIDEVHPVLLGIATRTPGRAEIIRHAAAAGVRALHVEKPLCNSASELETLRQIFARGEPWITLGTIRRFFKIYSVARELADSGRYGSLREIRVKMGHGALYWTHPHSVDLILHAAGARVLKSVQARLSNLVHGPTTTEILSDPLVDWATLHFEDGLVGHITRAPGADLVLSCTEGEIAVENDGRAISLSAREGADPYPTRSEYAGPPRPADAEGTFAPIAHLVECLKESREAIGLNARVRESILTGQAALFAMIQSHLERSRLVDVLDFDPALTVQARTGHNFA